MAAPASARRTARVHPHRVPALRVPARAHGGLPSRRPTATPLYPVVQRHLETFLARAAEGDPVGFGMPSWVERDFRGYLRCGILAHGFARARCADCAPHNFETFPLA